MPTAGTQPTPTPLVPVRLLRHGHVFETKARAMEEIVLNIEAGTDPSVTILLKLAQALGVRPAMLLE